MLGAAAMSKSTWIVLFPAFVGIWIVFRFALFRHRPRLKVTQLAIILAIAWAMLWAVYGFAGIGSAFDSLPMQSQVFRTLFCSASLGRPPVVHPIIARVPLPLPLDYVVGIDQQCLDFEGPGQSYLRGKWRTTGWWYYYAYGIIVKEPCGTLALAGWSMFYCAMLSCSARFRRRISVTRTVHWAAGGLMLVCPLVVFLLASVNTGMNHHVRYVMPVLPFLYVAASGAAIRRFSFWTARVLGSVSLLGYVVVSSVIAFPHSLSYFNEASGGMAGGSYHLNNSNIDWGQDLLTLRTWLHRNAPGETISLAYFGRVNPTLVGIQYEVPPMQLSSPRELKPGLYAISVTLLQGRGYQVPTPDGGLERAPQHAFSYFRELSPVGRAGYSINLYRIARPR
jgi:hypothetical protein